MAGIYIHIPFCRKACTYCDFHFSTNLQHKDEMIRALITEILERKDYLAGHPVNTVYFGGGTPSLLSSGELGSILAAVQSAFTMAPDTEVTLEANPDDIISADQLLNFKKLGINRLSIGIQSFYDEHLAWMNRAHTAAQADRAVKLAQEAGFGNITIDLIYGVPGMTLEQWKENLKRAVDLNIQHISAYCLTVEEKTVLDKMIREGRAKEVDDELVEQQVNTMVDMLADHGFERYEISNFAKPGLESRHNSSYWAGEWYLGIGPSAHSFNGHSRQWNISSNMAYTQAMKNGQPYCDIENIDETTAYNEYVMTRLRTSRGISLAEVKQRYMVDIEKDFEEEISYLIEDAEALLENGFLKLTHQGRFFADAIAASLFLDKDEK